jgi:hypothetical protein
MDMRNRCVATLLVTGAMLVLSGPACSSSPSNASSTDGGPAAPASDIGVACNPRQELDPTFLGFAEGEVNIETPSPSCASGTCLTNHFRGRVSCPYGQSATGQPPQGGSACATPTSGAPVTGVSGDTAHGARVEPQCADRTAAKTVYCSCRCANELGKTDDGAVYCACPDGFACEQLVASIGKGTAGIAGAYCIKTGTTYAMATACSGGDCDPVAKKCN